MSAMGTVAMLHQVDGDQVQDVISEMDKALGSLDAITIAGQQILVGVFIRPSGCKFKQPDGSYRLFHTAGTGKEQVEDVYQGTVVRILKMGPQAFNPSAFKSLANEWPSPDDIPKVGDWVVMRANDGIQCSYKGPGSMKTSMFDGVEKIPSNGGWPCRLVMFSDIMVKVSNPGVFV